MQVVLPGDCVRTLHSSSGVNHAPIKLGPGVMQLATTSTPAAGASTSGGEAAGGIAAKVEIASTKAGILGQSSGGASAGDVKPGQQPESVWVEAQGRRYVPAAGEPVIGVIAARHAEGYRVDIGSSQMAALDALAFEDATKRNKPELRPGAIVYARVSLALPFCEPEIECFDPKTGKSAGYGELKEGMLLRHLELGKCRALLSPKHPLLPSLGSKFPFELAIGSNGRIWVKTKERSKTIELMKAIQDA